MENYTCTKCKGKQIVSAKRKRGCLKKCPVCDGTGKINWLDNVFGKEEPKEIIQGRFFYSNPTTTNRYYNAQIIQKVMNNFASAMGVPPRYLFGQIEQNNKKGRGKKNG